MLAKIFLLLTLVSGNGEARHSSSGFHISDSVKRHGKTADPGDTLGKYVTVNKVFIVGNQITRDRIVLRELTLKTGDVIHTDDLTTILEKDRKKLLNTRLFNTVEIRALELEDNKIDLLIDVNERWYTFPAPLIELSDRNFNEWWRNYGHDFRRINYGLRLYQYNMRGRNETLRLHAQFGFQKKFEIMYRIPYIDKNQKQGLSFDFNFLETKNLAYRTFEHKYEFLKHDDILRIIRYGGVTYTYRNSFYQTHSFRLEYLSANVSDTVKLLNPIYLKGESNQQSFATASYTFVSDHRDLFTYPLKGHLFSLNVSRNGLLASDDLQKLEGLLSYSKYIDLKNHFYLSNNMVGYASTPDDISYMNFGVLGIRKQFVRGYELYVIEGPMYAMNKTTLKKLIFSRKYHWEAMPLEQFRHVPISIYLKTYADIGYVKNYPDYEKMNINTRLSNKLLSGAGFGVDIIGSYDVVIRIEYTINAEGERGFFFHLKREF
jgi:outer membrane protein assembly factor BamA